MIRRFGRTVTELDGHTAVAERIVPSATGVKRPHTSCLCFRANAYACRSGSFEYATDGCHSDTRTSIVTVKLANTAPATRLANYAADSVGGHADHPVQATLSSNTPSVALLAPGNARLTSVIVNVEMAIEIPCPDRGHPPHETQIDRGPGLTADNVTAGRADHFERPPCSGSAVGRRRHALGIGARMLMSLIQTITSWHEALAEIAMPLGDAHKGGKTAIRGKL